jgi:Transposase
MSQSILRLACYLAVVCGGSLRPIALLFAALFLMPMTTSSLKRWLDDIGSHVPPPEQMRQQLLALIPVTEGHSDGDYPLGTDHGAMVGKAEHDRMLRTQEAAAEHGDDAQQLLQRWKDRGLQVTAACSADAPSFTAAINAVFPHARLQADHCHTVKHIWGHLQKARLSSRRHIKAKGEEKTDDRVIEQATTLWKLRWSLLKKPGHVSGEAKQAIAALASEDTGFGHSLRTIIRPLVPSFDQTPSAAQAKLGRKQLSQDIHALDDAHLDKIRHFLDDHWEQAWRYLRTKGRGTPRRGANSESGMRLLRRLENNHDGIRSAATRQPYLQI